MPDSFKKWLPYFVGLVVVLALLFYSNQWQRTAPSTAVAYSQFKTLLADGEVTVVTLTGEAITADLKTEITNKAGQRTAKQVKTTIPAMGDPALLPALEAQKIDVVVVADTGSSWLVGMLPWVVLIGFYLFFMNRMYRNMSGNFGGRDASEFLTGSAKQQEKAGRQVTFDDVAGQENAKQEVSELVDLLKAPDRYDRLGAEPPHGVLLVGPPGTGKTLLARALAGEAGVPFFHISASEFIEMYVGVGASRVRKMFEEAKARAPAIIFIDELDAVGRVRGAGFGGGHDEREQTLNQILSEMDGFAGHETVIVLAATNRPDVLDPALLRPGRFDRHVTLELPDKDARAAILAVHTKKKPLGPDVDLGAIAAATPGFSGADLKNLSNEAAMAAAREDASQISMRHFDDMRDKVMMGSVRSMAIQPDEHHRLAVHEAGHTVVAYVLPNADPLYKVTIIPRGRTLGGTHMLPTQERHTLPAGYLQDQLSVMLAGRAAELALLGDASSGADDDIARATKLARAMVTRWGMSDKIGPFDLRQSEEHPFLGRDISQPREFSEQTAHEVDVEVRRLLGQADRTAGEALRQNKAGMERLIERLETEESLDFDAIQACLGDAARLTPPTEPAAADTDQRVS
jgi:cell division protease FtsH